MRDDDARFTGKPGNARVQEAPQDVPGGGRVFMHILLNTLVANFATGYLWFPLTFWVYLETQNVMATGIVGGTYLLLVAVLSTFFGAMVDRYRKRQVLILSSALTAGAFTAVWAFFESVPETTLLDLRGSAFWLLAGLVLFGVVVEQIRNIALSATVTLLVPAERRPNANGLVGTVQGLAFITTSVFSGLSVCGVPAPILRTTMGELFDGVAVSRGLLVERFSF